MKKDDEILKLTESLEESLDKLEIAYNKNNSAEFNQIKKLMLHANKKVLMYLNGI